MEKGNVTKLVLFIDIQLAILLGLVIFFGLSNLNTQKITGQDVLGVDIAESSGDFSVSVCLRDDCIYIPNTAVSKDGSIDEGMVYQEVLDKVVSHFERNYGGKAIATNGNGSFVYWKEDVRPDLTNIFKDVYVSFLSGLDTNIDIEMRDMPSTDGKYATKYIEVDNSRQKLYVWRNGQVEREILLSGPKEGYEVYGVFPIVDKGLNPKAPTGSFMPYWMAFHYAGGQESWYGLHGLIWWYDSNGRAVYEPESNIGVRRSGGCIRMVEEDAKYLYENFEKGDLILIHE